MMAKLVPLDLLPSGLIEKEEPVQYKPVPVDLLPSNLIAQEEPPTKAEPTKPVEEPSYKDRYIEAAKSPLLDLPVGLARGMVSGTRMIAETFGAGSDVTKAMRSTEDYIAGLMTAEAQNDAKKQAELMKQAEDAGLGDALRLAFKAFMVAPVDTVVSALGTSAPMILGALGAKFFGAGALGMTAVSTTLGAAQGTGMIKGTIYEAVKEAMIEAGDPPELAEQKAIEAQSYGGKNLDSILGGTALGALAGKTGVERIILNRIATKEAAKKGAVRQIGEGAVTESIPEMLQAGQEQLAENIALQREGFDVPTTRGLVSSAAFEGLAGAGAGAATAGIAAADRTPTSPKAKEFDDAIKKAEEEYKAKQKAAPVTEETEEIEEDEFEDVGIEGTEAKKAAKKKDPLEGVDEELIDEVRDYINTLPERISGAAVRDGEATETEPEAIKNLRNYALRLGLDPKKKRDLKT